MNPDLALDELANLAGIIPEYVDLSGTRQKTSLETKRALLKACGWQLDNSEMVTHAYKFRMAEINERRFPEEMVVRSGTKKLIPCKRTTVWHLFSEDGNEMIAEGNSTDAIELPRLPSGLYQLNAGQGKHEETIRIIAAPAKAPSVFSVSGQERLWGINLALYGLHSGRNKSVGDYQDLAQAAARLALHGAVFVGINPVHAIGWTSDKVFSPYSPSHRGFLNTNHIAVERVIPSSPETRKRIKEWREKRGPGTQEFVDYQDHSKHQKPLLLMLFEDFERLASAKEISEFDAYCEQAGEGLERFARFESLSERFGSDWRKWPAEFQNPDIADNRVEKHGFHAWLQWQAELQLSGANECARSSGMLLGLYLDLAVGARRDGAEAWGEADSIATGVSIGAPPDHLSPAGQNWNLAAFAPRKLAATNYKAFRSILASNMRNCGILRIDHVLGLNRSFWVPDDGSRGGYIRQNFEALLAIVRIEAERNKTVIIGEDLGLVPEGFRAALGKSGIYSYSVLQYEKSRSGAFRSPTRLRKQSLACFGTHDTPTLKGFESGSDIEWWKKLGWIDLDGANAAIETRAKECAGLSNLHDEKPGAKPGAKNLKTGQLSQAVHMALAASPVALVSVQFDDIEGGTEAQNLPGTVNEHPNWQRRYTTAVEAFGKSRILNEMGQIMAQRGVKRTNTPRVENI